MIQTPSTAAKANVHGPHVFKKSNLSSFGTVGSLVYLAEHITPKSEHEPGERVWQTSRQVLFPVHPKVTSQVVLLIITLSSQFVVPFSDW